MTKEEAVSIIEERICVTEYVESSYVDCVDIEALRMVIKALEQSEQRWIPVDKGKPKDGTVCLVSDSKGLVEIATFAEDLYEFDEYDFHGKRGVSGWFYFDNGWGMYFDVDNVVAWMPLPEAYRSET